MGQKSSWRVFVLCHSESVWKQIFTLLFIAAFFVKGLGDFLKNNPEIKYVDIWDDTFNINEDWVIKICNYLKYSEQRCWQRNYIFMLLKAQRLE